MTETLPIKILVVDDELPLATAIRETLGQHGYAVTVAGSADEALTILGRDRFEIMLTDLHLPGTNGIALLAAALLVDPRMIGIMMTGQGSIDTAVAAMKAGAHDYILKPFKLSVALAVLARARATRQLRIENESLHRRLRARTADLEAANRELEAFSYSVSHDLRAPLRSIEGFVGILQEELGPEPAPALQDCLRRITAGSQRMGRLIEDLLRLAQVARQPPRREPVDLTAVAREIASKLAAASPARTVRWELQAVPPALGDPGLLRVVMDNLLANAWKYTRHTTAARIEFRVDADGDGDGAVVYRVSDNGAGFDMKQAGNLFMPFQRLHPESLFEGSGIGLATVQRIVQRHEGRIWAEAVTGQGATFRFTLAPAGTGGSASGLPPS